LGVSKLVAIPGKMFARPPSPSIGGHGGMCLSSQLQWEA
jgi:hypothetical protein